MKPHKHAEVIKAWADGNVVQCRSNSSNGWRDVTEPSPNWHLHCEYRIKPELPKYPQTKMTDEELIDVANKADAPTAMRRLVANAAIARAIEDGQIIATEAHADEIVAQRMKGFDDGREGMVPASVLDKLYDRAMEAAAARLCVKSWPGNVTNATTFGRLALLDELLNIDKQAIIEAVKQGK